MDTQSSLPEESEPVTMPEIAPQPEKPKRNLLWWIVGIGCAVLCLCLFIPILVISVLTIMGPTIGNVFSDINQQLEITAEAPALPGNQNATGSIYYADPLGNALGDPKAPLTMIIYSDFQCPYCMYFAQDTEPQIISEYVDTGKLYLVYRTMDDFIGEESRDAALGAYCAGEQDYFWEYHDLLFANLGGENEGSFSRENLRALAGLLPLDQSAFEDCFSSGRYLDRILQDRLDAEEAGVGGTPAFVINGKIAVEGAQPFEVFQSVIDELLQNQ